MSGLYVAIEGIDGCGKTTLVEGLRDRFPDALFTQEPKESLWTGKALRKALRRDTGPFTDALLFMADRAEHLHRVVVPALRDGRLVVSDRSADSTYAYQEARVEADDPFAWFDACYEPWDVKPDLTLWLDVPVDVAIDRVDGDEKYERRERLRRVQHNYKRLNMMHEDRYYRIDAGMDKAEVLAEAAAAIEGAL